MVKPSIVTLVTFTGQLATMPTTRDYIDITNVAPAPVVDIVRALSICGELLLPHMPDIVIDVDYLGRIYLITDSVAGQYDTKLVGCLVAVHGGELPGHLIAEVHSDHWDSAYSVWPEHVSHPFDGGNTPVLRAKLREVTGGEIIKRATWYDPRARRAASEVNREAQPDNDPSMVEGLLLRGPSRRSTSSIDQFARGTMTDLGG